MFALHIYNDNMLTQCDDFLHCCLAEVGLSCELWVWLFKMALIVLCMIFWISCQLKEKKLAGIILYETNRSVYAHIQFTFILISESIYLYSLYFYMIETLLWQQKYFITIRSIHQNILSKNNIWYIGTIINI